MPDVVTRGPYVELLRQMGVQGVQDRYHVAGEVPVSICLLHGIHHARVHFSVAVPMLGHGVYGKPVLVVAVQVACYHWCGYRLGWA